MAQDHEEPGFDRGSGLEALMALPVLWANNEYGTTGCLAIRASLHIGGCGLVVDLPEWRKGQGIQW
jgi:hypothetical protein